MTILTEPAILAEPAILPEDDQPISLLPVGGQPNARLAYAVLDQIDLFPAQWDQKRWIYEGECGTTGCFAGWACLLAGDMPLKHPVLQGVAEYGYVAPWPGAVVKVRDRATQLLNINYLQALSLFDCRNNRRRLGHQVEWIFGPRP